jgi:DNA replication protein DnaC
MIFTTNKPHTEWGRALHDEGFAQAIVYRILKRGRLLTLDGPSMRTKQLGLTTPLPLRHQTQAARISGTRS